MKFYEIVRGDTGGRGTRIMSSFRLQDEVNRRLRDGYELVGGPFVVNGCWCQAMVHEHRFDDEGVLGGYATNGNAKFCLVCKQWLE